jgi:hypothetical protein
MKALGRGSIASILKVVLDIAWVLLWVVGFIVLLVLLAYLAALTGKALGLFGHDPVFAWLRREGLEGAPEGPLRDILLVSGLCGALLLTVGGLVIIDRLKRLFANFVSNRPFVKENADHLRAIWAAMLTLELARFALGAATWVLAAALTSKPYSTTVRFELRLEVWFSIFTLMVLAEVFRVGARMREEQDLTV